MRFLYRALRWLELGTQNPQKLTVGAYPCVSFHPELLYAPSKEADAQLAHRKLYLEVVI